MRGGAHRGLRFQRERRISRKFGLSAQRCGCPLPPDTLLGGWSQPGQSVRQGVRCRSSSSSSPRARAARERAVAWVSFCLSGLVSFCLRSPELRGCPGSGALSRVGVCTLPPRQLGAGGARLSPRPRPGPAPAPVSRRGRGRGAAGRDIRPRSLAAPASRPPPAPAPQPRSRPPPRAPGSPAAAPLPEPSRQRLAQVPGSRPQPGPASPAARRPAGPAQAPTSGAPCSPAR